MNRRKRKLIRLDMQLKTVFITLFVACLVLLINFQMSLAALWSISVQPLATVDLALEEIRHVIVKKFLLTVVMTVPLAAAVGIIYSFKFSGPIYKFQKYLNELVTGPWDQKCWLRKGDDLKDVCESINNAVGAMRDRVRESHEVLQEARLVLDEVAYTVDENGKTRIRSLKERIEREDRVWRERFPSSMATPVAVAAAAPPVPVKVGPAEELSS